MLPAGVFENGAELEAEVVQKVNVIWAAVVLAACVAGPAVVGGCSQSKERRAEQTLFQEVDRAERLFNRALAFLGNPVYQIKGRAVPAELTSEPKITDVLVPPAGELHPEALPTLKQAEEVLSKALSGKDAASANAADKAIAQGMLGRIVSWRGDCEAFLTSQALVQLEDIRARTEDAIASTKLRFGLLECSGQLAVVDDGDIRRLGGQAAESRTKTLAELKQIDDRLAVLAEAKTVQDQTYEKLNAEARVLSMEGRMGADQDGKNKLDEGLKRKAGADAAELEATKIEHEVDTLKLRRQGLELDLEIAEKQIVTADKALEQMKVNSAESVELGQRVLTRLQAAQEGINGMLTAIVQVCDQVALSQAKALSSYQLACRQLEMAGRAQTRIAADIAAQQADVLVAMADLESRCLAASAANRRLAEEVTDLWAKLEAGNPPAEVAKIQSFIPDLDELRKDAQENYAGAAKLYEKVQRSVDPDLRWAYQGLAAMAYMKLHKLSQDPNTLADARKAFKDALDNKRYSPNVATLVELERILEEGQKTSPTSGPATQAVAPSPG